MAEQQKRRYLASRCSHDDREETKTMQDKPKENTTVQLHMMTQASIAYSWRIDLVQHQKNRFTRFNTPKKNIHLYTKSLSPLPPSSTPHHIPAYPLWLQLLWFILVILMYDDPAVQSLLPYPLILPCGDCCSHLSLFGHAFGGLPIIYCFDHVKKSGVLFYEDIDISILQQVALVLWVVLQSRSSSKGSRKKKKHKEFP